MFGNCNYLLLLGLLAKCWVFAAATSPVGNGTDFRNDYTLQPEADGWLKLHWVPRDWHSARIQCYREGAVLASPLNPQLHAQMMKMLSEARCQLPYVFTGVSATISDGAYSSVEGVPLENLHINWDVKPINNPPLCQAQQEQNKTCSCDAQQEDNNMHQCLAQLEYDKKHQCLAYKNNGIAFYNCDEPLPYFCYRRFSVNDELTECGTVDKGYKMDNRTGHCYKFHERGAKWGDAASTCQAEGGHLAVIDSPAEAELLKELFAAHPKLLFTRYQHLASVGFKMWGDKTWWTIHGKALEDSGYSHFGMGQPNNLGGRQECGAISRRGEFDDVWCDQLFAFICEKSPDSLSITDDVYYRTENIL